MASNYPSGFDTPSDTHVDNVDEKITAATVNDLADAVTAIQHALGLNPHQGNIGSLYTDVVSRLNALDTPSIKNVTPPYTLVKGDMAVVLNTLNTTDQNVTIPPNSAVAFPVGATISVRVAVAGMVTFVAGAGVTLHPRGSAVKSAGTNSMIAAFQHAVDHWTILGDVV